MPKRKKPALELGKLSEDNAEEKTAGIVI